VLDVTTGPADAAERTALNLPAEECVIRIRRVRSLGGRPLILETVSLPADVFPGLQDSAVPNNLYSLFATRYGITVANARERLKAVVLSADQAGHLGVAPGTPALEIDRIALSLDGSAVERRLSLCLTGEAHYQSDLR
jgi:GntR family transcriptional regulator